MAAPVGAPGSRLNLRLLAGISTSVAVLVMTNAVPATIVRSAMAARMGAVLTSLTVIVMVSEASMAGEPLSVTRNVTKLAPGPWASVGVQVNVRVAALKLASAGAPGSML